MKNLVDLIIQSMKNLDHTFYTIPHASSYGQGLSVAIELYNNRPCNLACFWREKGRDLTQSFDKSPYTSRQFQKSM